MKKITFKKVSYSLICFCLLNIPSVFARNIKSLRPDDDGGVIVAGASDKKCDSLFGQLHSEYMTNPTSLADYIQFAFEIFKFVGILACIVFSVIDLFKYLTADEKDSSALYKKILKRLIYTVLLFFLPILVKLLMGFVTDSEFCVK